MGECLLRSGLIRLDAGDAPARPLTGAALLVNRDLPPRTGEEAMFEAGCHAMLSSVAGVSGSGVSATDRPSEVEKAMMILRGIIADNYHAPELRTESCLEPLRSLPEFQLLMLDVGFPDEPFTR